MQVPSVTLVITTDGASNIQQTEHLRDGRYFWIWYACYILELAVQGDMAAIANYAGFIGISKKFITM